MNSRFNIIQKKWGGILIIAVLTMTAYAFMLSGDFKTMDDRATITDNPDLRSFANIPAIFTKSFFGGDAYYRPLVTFSNLLNYQLSGLHPFSYNLTNLFLHLLAALSVFALLEFLLKDRLLGFCGGLLFAVHPIHWSAVSNVAGRSIILCGLFFVLSMLCFGLARERRSAGWYLLSLGCFVLTLLSKEAGAVLPAILFFYLLFYRKEEKWFWPACVWIAPFAFIDALYVALRKILGITKVAFWPSWQDGVLGVSTFLRSVLTHLRLTVLPTDLYFDRARKFFTDFSDPALLLTMAVYAAAALVLYLRRSRIRREGWFLLVWFGITLLPVAQIVPIVASAGYASTAEHFLYIPSIGLVALLVLLCRHVGRWMIERKFLSDSLPVFCVICLYAFFILTTIQNNIYSNTEVAMLERSLEFNPHNSRVQSAMGLALAEKGLFREAEAHFREAVRIDPWDSRGRIGLGKVLFDQGKYFEGLDEYEKVVNPGAMRDLLQNNLQLSYDFLIDRYRIRIAEDPQNPQLHYSLGVVYSRARRFAEAIEEYRQALRFDPAFKNALYNLAVSWEALGKPDEAEKHYRILLASQGGAEHLNYQAHLRLADLHEKRGEREQAREHQRQAAQISSSGKEFQESYVIKIGE